jgi:pimeloyl-ACP methyl ester carboxylesterase
VPPAAQAQNLVAVQTATGCNDVAWPRSADHYARAVARNRRDFPLTAGMPANIWACAFWPYDAEKPVRITARGPDNVLLIQNRRDPATPYSGALRMLAAFGHRARMVTVSSGGHDAYLANGNACGDDAVTAFLTDGTHENAAC